MEPKLFVGYWNKDEVNPEITFEVPKDQTQKVMVLVTIEELPNESSSLGKFSNKCKKLDRGLTKLIKSTNKLRTKFR